MAQQGKDWVLSLLWLGSLQWHGSVPGLGTSICFRCGQKQKQKAPNPSKNKTKKKKQKTKNKHHSNTGGSNTTENTYQNVCGLHSQAFLLGSLVAEQSLPETECLRPPQIHVLKPNLQGDGVGRWGLWEEMRSEGGAFRNGMSALLFPFF